jgi:hypothetical protein
MTSNNSRIEHILCDVKHITNNILVLTYTKEYYETIFKIIINSNELQYIEKIIVGHSIFNIIRDEHNNINFKTTFCYNQNIEEHNTIVLYFTKKYLANCIQNIHYIGTYVLPFYSRFFSFRKNNNKFNLSEIEFNNLKLKNINSFEKITTFTVKTPSIYIELVKPKYTHLVITN